ncbi:MAG TPA: hypothetical protein VGJ48_15050, partial [Pyrinomonadaceae bacterium]
MKNLTSACLLCLLLSWSGGVQGRANPPSTGINAASEQRVNGMTPEEKVVRAVYEKLTKLNRAALLSKRRASLRASEEDVLNFELSNFHVGPIQEIFGKLHRKTLTDATGEIISLERVVTQLNKEPEHVAYEAEWTTGQYASGAQDLTIGDLLGLEPALNYDVGEYALYDVVVSFKGKSRAYRALALFHNAYGSVEYLKPSFWDSVVGIGGALTDVWNEKRPPVGESDGLSIGKPAPSRQA